MKIVVDIPESILNTIQVDEMISREQLAVLQMHILNGTPLDKIRDEIEQFAKNPDFGDLSIGASCGAMKAIEIIDMYKAERSGRE